MNPILLSLLQLVGQVVFQLLVCWCEITKDGINKLPVITILAKILPVSATTTAFSCYCCFFQYYFCFWLLIYRYFGRNNMNAEDLMDFFVNDKCTHCECIQINK